MQLYRTLHLEGLGIGEIKSRDCEVTSIDSKYSVLNCLLGQSVNVDELMQEEPAEQHQQEMGGLS